MIWPILLTSIRLVLGMISPGFSPAFSPQVPGETLFTFTLLETPSTGFPLHFLTTSSAFVMVQRASPAMAVIHFDPPKADLSRYAIIIGGNGPATGGIQGFSFPCGVNYYRLFYEPYLFYWGRSPQLYL